MKRIAIVDADLWAYKCSAASETRSIEVLHEPTGIKKAFSNRTEFKKVMLEKGKEITSDYVIQDTREVEPLEYCLSVIKHKANNIQEELQADKVLYFCGDEWNFRESLELPTKYKGARKDTLRPLHLDDAKSYIKNVLKAESAVGYEVDDKVCITAYNELFNGNIPILSSIDKDCQSHNGIYLHNPDSGEIKLVPELGSLYLNKNGNVKGDGLLFLCHQWIFGDRSDNYIPYELSSARFGEKASYKLLSECKTVQEALLKVIQQFKLFYPDKFEYTTWDGKQVESDWKHMLELYFACCWMKRSEDDDSKPYKLFDKYGVDL